MWWPVFPLKTHDIWPRSWHTETLNEELTWQGAMIPAILRPARTMLQLAHGADMGIEGLQLGRAPSWQKYGNRSNSFCHISELLLSRDPMHGSSPYGPMCV